MISRRSFLQFAGLTLIAPKLAFADEHQQIGQMFARYIGEAGGVHRWAFRSHHIDSAADLDAPEEYLIEIVLPDNYPGGGPYPVLYIGPVNREPNARGDGLRLAQQENIHNEYGCILVSGTFKSMPWYGTKNDGTRRIDTHIRWNVLPLLEQFYDAIPDREGKLFIGFSKSGWGALSMILRGPAYFGYAAAWDSPWEMSYGSYGTADAFGSEARFNNYDPKQILATRASSVNDRERIWISAGRTFLDHHGPMVQRLTDLGIPHRARYLEVDEHIWDADWMQAGCRALFEMRAG